MIRGPCARLTIACKLDDVVPDLDAFTVSLSQVIQDAPAHARLHVRAWPRHSGWLPIPLLFPNMMVTISGTVLAFQHGLLHVDVDGFASWPRRIQVQRTLLTHEDMEALD